MNITFGGILYDPTTGVNTQLAGASLPVQVDPSHRCYSMVELYFNLGGSPIALYAAVWYLRPDGTSGPSVGEYLLSNDYLICYNYDFTMVGLWKVEASLGSSFMESWNVFNVTNPPGTFSDMKVTSFAKV